MIKLSYVVTAGRDVWTEQLCCRVRPSAGKLFGLVESLATLGTWSSPCMKWEPSSPPTTKCNTYISLTSLGFSNTFILKHYICIYIYVYLYLIIRGATRTLPSGRTSRRMQKEFSNQKNISYTVHTPLILAPVIFRMYCTIHMYMCS